MAEQNAANARQAAVATYAFQQNRISQERAAAVQQQTENSIKTMKAVSNANVAAGEAGVNGLSVDALMGDFLAQGARANNVVDQNYQMQRDYLVGEMESTRAKTQSQINSVPQPSLLNLGLNIATAGVSGAASYQKAAYLGKYGKSLEIE